MTNITNAGYTSAFTRKTEVNGFFLNAWRQAGQIIVTRDGRYGLILLNLTEVTNSPTDASHVGFIVDSDDKVKPASWSNDGTNNRGHKDADIIGVLEFNFIWHDINPEYDYLAMDSNGRFCFYDAKPEASLKQGQWLNKGSDSVRASAILPRRLPKIHTALWSGVLISREED